MSTENNATSSNSKNVSPEVLREEKMRLAFDRFRLGLSVFFVGLVFLYITQQFSEPSLLQEIFTLICTIVMAAGFVLAIISELRFLWLRFANFFNSK